MKTVKWMSVMLALIACAFTFSACGDDEETGTAGAPYTGVWEAVQAEGVDEEEGAWSYDVEKGGVVLTLNENKTFTLVDNVSDGGSYLNDGTWEFKDNQLVLTKKTNTYVAQGIHDVISWSASTLKMKVWYHHKDPSKPDDYDEWVIFTFKKK